MNNNSAIVFGASGFIGTRLLSHLAQSNPAIRYKAIDILPPRVVLPNVDYQTLDVREPLPAALGVGVHRIYNLAAVHRTPGHPAHEYYDTNIGGALNVTALAEACGISEILFTSSISVYGPSEEVKTEASELTPVSAYGKSKRFAEQIHRRWRTHAEERRLVIVRPGVVFGPGERGNYTNLAKALKRRAFAYPGKRDVVKSGGYVDDLIGAIEFAFDQPDSYSLFNFAYPAESTLEDIVGVLAGIAGVRSQYPTIPAGAMLSAAFVFEKMNAAGLKNPIHRERIHKLVNSTRIAPDWLRNRRYPFKMDLKSALQHWSNETAGKFD